PGIFGQIVTEVERMKPDFVLTVGDMIEGYTADTVKIKQEWEEYLALIEPLTSPIYHTAGNHDFLDTTALNLYRRYIGKPYYSFTRRGLHFIILDSGRYNSVTDFPKEQIDWLIDDLEMNKDAFHTIVFYHIPYWIETIAQDKPDTLHTIFVKYGVDAVFTGHYHIYFSGTFDGITYTSLGSSGGGCSPGPTGLQYHFAWVTVDRDRISIAPVKMDAVLPWEELSAKEYLLTRKAEYLAIKTGKAQVSDDLTIPEKKITITVENFNTDVILKDTLSWDVPAGWTVSPTVLPIEIEPLKTYSTSLTVKSTGNLYPTPTASMNYGYAEGKEVEIEHTLGVSRTAYAYEATEPPVIDGELKDALWKRAVTELFAPDGSSISTTDPVSFYFAWDEKNLYIAARCTEKKMDAIVATATKHDGAVYGEDCVGYFFQPVLEDGPIYQIYFNPLGTPFDQKIIVEEKTPVDVERDWNGTYEVKTFKGEDHWSIEARIPLDQLGAEAKRGKIWGTNFRRKQKRLNTSADWLVPINYDPETYGFLMMR
ncbi:hypothetical protein E3J62_09115, partial [candidate division TA06 bacterium]